LLALWKRRGNPGLRRYLLRMWVSSLQEGLPPFPQETVVVGVEPHPARLLARGFDPVLPFVRSLSKYFCIPTLRALVRTHDTPHQALLPAREREKNVKGSFSLRPGVDREIQGRPVVLVDDVMTTGATLNEAAKALRKAKPGYILGVVFARTLKGRQDFLLLAKPRG
jgi:predicted amidophosphoribosyltransferase